jgi:hypothetical protein
MSYYTEIESERKFLPDYLGNESSEEELRLASARCPVPSRDVISGFPRYHRAFHSLPPGERAKIVQLAARVIRSFAPGCQPITQILFVGHADRDLQRGPDFEYRISFERALRVRNALAGLIYSRGTTRRRAPSPYSIKWLHRAAGANRLLVRNAATEQQRARNRRVEIFVGSEGTARELSDPVHIRRVQNCLNQVLATRIAPTGKIGLETRNAVRAFQQRRKLEIDGLINPQTSAALLNLCGAPIAQPASAGPAVMMRSSPQQLDRWVGQGRDNLREDVRDTMDRLHLLWSITNDDYDAEYPGVSALPAGSKVPETMIPLTIAAIGRNAEATLHPAVAAHFMNVSLADPVGRKQKNNKSDILSLQVPLRALGLLIDPDYTNERTAVTSITTPTVPDAIINKTLDAISALKDSIAGGRLGWAPIRADESEAGGDRFGGRTFRVPISSLCFHPRRQRPGPEAHWASVFVPSGAAPDVNKVHVFFSPGGVVGDSGLNATLFHGLRAASESSEWILLSVSGINEDDVDGWRTIDRSGIAACLTVAGRSTNDIHALRLTAHSRGAFSLRESIRRKFLTGSIDRIVILDASRPFLDVPIGNLLRTGGASAGSIIHYGVNSSRDLPGARNIRLDPMCARAIGYSRLIQDAIATRRYTRLAPTQVDATHPLVIPADVSTQLLRLPPRGGFTTSASSSIGQPNLRIDCNPRLQTCLCHDQRAGIAAIQRTEIQTRTTRHPEGLWTFIEQNDLTHMLPDFSMPPGTHSHHTFVAEIAHELVS